MRPETRAKKKVYHILGRKNRYTKPYESVDVCNVISEHRDDISQ